MADKSDPELDALLESAAKDFAKRPEKASTSDPSFDPSQFLNQDGSLNHEKWKKWQEEQEIDAEALAKKAEEDFENSDLAKELDKKLGEGLAAASAEMGLSPDEVANRLKNLKLFGGAPVGDSDAEKEFANAIQGAMASLRENLSEAFPGALKLEECDAELKEFSNIMRNVMSNLLSKEMMLPSFKELSEKYPAWLEENKSKLSEADLKRYTEQLEVVKQIVAELEKEGAEDDKQHLDRMVELMGKAQELGQPPEGLTAQLGNAIDDTKIDAMLKDSGADQCNIM